MRERAATAPAAQEGCWTWAIGPIGSWRQAEGALRTTFHNDAGVQLNGPTQHARGRSFGFALTLARGLADDPAMVVEPTAMANKLVSVLEAEEQRLADEVSKMSAFQKLASLQSLIALYSGRPVEQVALDVEELVTAGGVVRSQEHDASNGLLSALRSEAEGLAAELRTAAPVRRLIAIRELVALYTASPVEKASSPPSEEATGPDMPPAGPPDRLGHVRRRLQEEEAREAPRGMSALRSALLNMAGVGAVWRPA